MLDVDIQGAEYRLFDSYTIATLSSRVMRIHIGLHGLPAKAHHAQIVALKKRFLTHGWERATLVPPSPGPSRLSSTRWGMVKFSDGAASFVNTNRMKLCTEHGNE